VLPVDAVLAVDAVEVEDNIEVAMAKIPLSSIDTFPGRLKASPDSS